MSLKLPGILLPFGAGQVCAGLAARPLVPRGTGGTAALAHPTDKEGALTKSVKLYCWIKKKSYFHAWLLIGMATAFPNAPAPFSLLTTLARDE